MGVIHIQWLFKVFLAGGIIIFTISVPLLLLALSGLIFGLGIWFGCTWLFPFSQNLHLGLAITLSFVWVGLTAIAVSIPLAVFKLLLEIADGPTVGNYDDAN